ncbi:unnamed protein product [Owenia fusiformis]|uniref:Uncharacterized protein n=1 Tax=Owenia fusiformis TaxID=6347 RepID=A0A8J1TWB0_OWEFU|nr:unnamed protein product [Owenia fusiformis]
MKVLIVTSLLLFDVCICMRGNGRYRGNVRNELVKFMSDFKAALMDPKCSVDLDCSGAAMLFTEDAIMSVQDVPPAYGTAEVVKVIQAFKNQDRNIYLGASFEDITQCKGIITAYGKGTVFSLDAQDQPMALYQKNLVFTFHREKERRKGRKLKLKYWVDNNIP